MGSFAEGTARDPSIDAFDVPAMERRNMSRSEREQCELDNFWGLVANQAVQAEATAAMEMEDRRSQAVRARLKKEETYALWENEDRRTKETRSTVREDLEDAARREYLEAFYSAPSADFAINYKWPTRAVLPQASDQQLSDQLDTADPTATTATGSHGATISRRSRGDRSTAPPSTAPSTTCTRDRLHRDWSSVGSSSRRSSTRESTITSTRPFHSFRGKKTHKIVPVRASFVPPRHLSEPTPKHGLVSVEGIVTSRLSLSGCKHGQDNTRSNNGRPVPGGLTKAVHLPPMLETPPAMGGGAGLPGSAPAPGGGGGSGLALNKSTLLPFKPGAPGQPTVPSFERKFAARHEQWSREAELDAEERAVVEKIRTEELLRRSTTGIFSRQQGHYSGGGAAGRGGDETRDKAGCQHSGGTGGCFEGLLGAGYSSERTRRRRGRGASAVAAEGKVTELVPEIEQELLTQMFGMLDSRERGEVRLDEALFHMAENVQVKYVLRQVALWTLIKTRRWGWLEELFAARPGRTLTLAALLDYSRGLHKEKGVPRRYLRLAGAQRVADSGKRDVRSRRLLPAELVEGQEVEALFMKGFEWYRAWIVRCNVVDDTFDVRYTRPCSPSPESSVASASCEGQVAAAAGQPGAGEQRPEVETLSQASWPEETEHWDRSRNEGEDSTAAAEEEWKATCESVARYIGVPPDLGETEAELLERAYDAIARCCSPSKTTTTTMTKGSDNNNNNNNNTEQESSREEGTTITRQQPRNQEQEQQQQSSIARQQQQQQPIPAAANNNGEHENLSRDSFACRNTTTTTTTTTTTVTTSSSSDNTTTTQLLPPSRVCASEILRLLRGEEMDEFRRASPALRAACMYREFAQGLENAASNTGRSDSSADCSGGDSSRGGTGGGGGGGGVSKAEFCEYFEAVTDLVDLNDLSLAPAGQGCRGGGGPTSDRVAMENTVHT